MRRMLLTLAAAGFLVLGLGLPARAHFVPNPCDFITSGGFVFTDSDGMVNFGAHGGCKNGDFWGHINVVDHGTGLHFDSTDITGYLIDTSLPNARDICGTGVTNTGETVTFRVRLIDNGEPGTSDEFGIRLSDGYLVSTRLLADGGPGGGNVQLHKPNNSTKGPRPAPTEAEMCGTLTSP